MQDRASLVTEFIIEAFRLNGELLEAGDALVRDIGLTSARWQVLGAIAMSPAPLPVAHTARNMGLSRQAVQRIANELEAEGLISFAPNPHHARAKLLLLKEKGARAYAAAMERQRPWATQLGARLTSEDIKTALRVMRAVRDRLETSAVAKRSAADGFEKHK
jgi:DNA-binding MarR family transcriptional regulator